MQQETVTLIVAGLGIGGTLGGIVVGHFLTRSSQHAQWLRDRRLEEYKSVLAAVNEMFEAYSFPVSAIMPNSFEAKLKQAQTVSRCFRTIANCVMIADDLKGIDLFKNLLECQGHFDLTQSTEGFGADRRYLVNLILKMAHECL